MLQDLIDILAAPEAMFARLKDKPTFWLPLVLMIISTTAATAGYLLLNDEGYVRDQIIEQALARNPDMPAEQQRAIERSMENISIRTQAIISCMAILLAVPAITALYAGYLVLMNKFSSKQFGFHHWFALACWIGIPNALAGLASLAVLLTDANGQVSQAELQPLSITGLLGLSTDSQMLQQVNLLTLWSLALAAIGYGVIAGKDLLTSAAITWAPYLLIYGGLALAAL